MAASDAVVVPSLYEPFGLVALEATAAGAPLVVARSGGLAEVVRDGVTGLTFPAADVAALADSVTATLRDQVGARRRVRRLRAELARDHTWSGVERRTTETYRRAIDEETVLTERSRRPRGPGRLDGNLLLDGP
jgi:glycogen(starch) synthase